jgi:TldD protein
MKDFAQLVVEFLKQEGVQYGDVRVVSSKRENIRVKNGLVDEVEVSEDLGFGVRVLIDGYWGFASSYRLIAQEADKVVRKAVEVARSSKEAKGIRVNLSEEEVYVDTYRTPFKKDPFKVSLQEKINLLMETDRILRSEKLVTLTVLVMSFLRYHQVFASTEGALIEQELLESGGGYTAYSLKDGELQSRSYPAAHGGNFFKAGYEVLEEMDFLKHAERVKEELARLVQAKPAPTGEMDLVLGTNQMALQIHESIGHAVELDRVLGFEASYAGTSFATLEKLENFRYGSEIMNVYTDAITERALGTFGYDDEGVKAKRSWIIKEGILVGYQTSRETAPIIGRKSTGNMRAEGWSRIPLIRMTNLCLEPGDKSLEELIGEIDEGIFLDTNRSWSIDQKRLNFQFGTEIGWLIKKGKLTEVVKNPVYTGITPLFWRSMDAVANESHWELWGIPNCGKGEPGQSASVAHGASPARFRKVTIRSAG